MFDVLLVHVIAIQSPEIILVCGFIKFFLLLLSTSASTCLQFQIMHHLSDFCDHNLANSEMDNKVETLEVHGGPGFGGDPLSSEGSILRMAACPTTGV